MANQKLTIVAKIIAKTGHCDLVKKELVKLIEITKTEEGCIDYDLHQDNENDHIFLFYENWESRELWQKHMNAAHIAKYKIVTEGAVEGFTLNEMTPVR